MASSETFKPGLFDIGLNIEKKLSKQDLLVFSEQLTYHLDTKPKYMEPAIRNLQAVLSFHMDLGRKKARLMLEKLIREYPHDLNIIADLIYVYKKMGRVSDYKRYERLLDSLKVDTQLQVRSILAQAYALNYDVTDEHDKTPKVLLKDTHRLLRMEDKHSEQVNKAIDLVEDAYKVFNTIPWRTFEKTIAAKENAIEKFEEGIKILEKSNCSKEEIFVWKFNLANARDKMDTWRLKRLDDFDNCRFDNCVKVLEIYLDVIENLSPVENLEKPLKVFVARSYILFAQFYMLRKEDLDKNTNTPKRIKRENHDLDSMYLSALSICPEDKTVLQRCGRYQYNKKKYLDAIKHYDKCISLYPDEHFNWFAYSSRSEACLSYGEDLKRNKSNKEEIDKYFKNAYNDSKVSLQSKSTEMCMLRMAECCYLSAMPDDESGKLFQCQHKKFIYEALEILHETIIKREITNYAKIYSDFGLYYPYVGEYRKAIQSVKKTLALSEWSEQFPEAFSMLRKCFVIFYKEEKDKNLLREFCFMLKEAKKRHCDHWVTTALNMMYKYDPHVLADLLEEMIEWDAKGCMMLIDEVLIKSQDPQESSRIFQNLRVKYEKKLQEESDLKSDINGPTEIQRSWSPEENFKYDFYVSHSEKEKDWVNWILRPEIEEFDSEIKFKGFIPGRDNIPGDNVIDSMKNGIKQSCKLLIILTPDYINDNWSKIVSNVMIFSVIETKVKEKTIIPIIREKCDIPDMLKPFHPVYFTEESNWDRLRRGLTVNMGPAETGLEEKMSALTTCDIDEN